MPDSLAPYVDGWLGTERELTVVPQPQFPFRNNPIPDIYSRLQERRYQILPRLFLPKIANRTAWSNLVTYSEQIDNAAWTKTNLTVTANAGTAPDGQATLDKLLETVTNAEHSVTQAATVTAAATEVTVFAVGGLTRSWIRLAFVDSAATTFSAFFNIASGYVGTKSAGVTAKIVALGLGQFRCVIQFTPAAGAGTFKANVSTDGTVISYAGTTSAGVYLWGAQVTTGSETPYISTTSATRAVSTPDRDRVDPMAYLIEEDDPKIVTSESGETRRVFGRIPSTQTVPNSLFVTKPDVPGIFPQVFGNFRLFQPVATVASYDAYAANAVTSDSGATSGFYPTGGSYTLSFGGFTTGSLNYNDSSTTVQTALNALTSISNRGNVTVAGTYNSPGGFTITFGTYAQITIATGSLTGFGSKTELLSNGGYSQIIAAQRAAADGTVDASGLTRSGGPGGGASAGWNFNPSSIRRDFIINNQPGVFTGGTFKLTIYSQQTAAIAYDASFADVQSALNALGVGTFLVEAIDGTGDTQPLTADAMLIRAKVTWVNVPVTGGTFTLTAFGNTTGSLNYNDSAATVSIALNALTGVTNRGGCVVSGTLSTGFTISFSNALITSAIGSLTPAGSNITHGFGDSSIGRIQTAVFSSSAALIRTLFAAAHGISAGDTIYLKGDGIYYTNITAFTVPNPDTILLQILPSLSYVAVVAMTEVGRKTTAAYTPGSSLTRVSRVTSFYLPGVQPGINSVDDIPLPVYQGDPASLLTAIFSGSTSINYQVGELEQWRGPILQRTLTTLNATQL